MKVRKAILEKMKKVEEMTEALKGKDPIIIIDLRNTPNKLIQRIRKKLKEGYGAFVKGGKLIVFKKSLENIGIPEALYSDLTFPSLLVGLNGVHPYHIALEFEKEILPLAAKPGQVAEEDIIIEKGPTDLPPGPALSELKMAGLDARIEKGKIAIMKEKVLVKKGETITPIHAKVLQILGLKPFKAKAKIWKAYYQGIIFPGEVLKLLPEELGESLSQAFQHAINLSLEASILTESNAEILLLREFQRAKNLALNGLVFSPEFLEEQLSLANAIAEGIKKELNLS